MSLKSTRKRLKDCLEFEKNYSNDKKTSTLQNSLETRPNFSERQFEDQKRKLNYIEKSKIEKAKKDAYKININKNETNIRNKIRFTDQRENLNLNERNKDGTSKRKILVMILVELITLVVIFGIGFAIRLSNSTQVVPFNAEQVRNQDIDVRTLDTMKGYRTIAIFGLDSRTGSVGKGNNADVNIIANIDLSSGAVQLISIYRDLYLNVTDDNVYGKINSAYMHGGPEKAVKALNKNLDLDITNYVSFNWKAVAQGIDMLGGIDLEITKSEYRYMNSFIHETCRATGIDKDNPAANYISESGYQHLNGVQSVAYARLRLMDSDFQRVERQRKVIDLCLEKAKKLDFNSIMGIAISIIPTVSYNFDWGEMTSLVKSIDGIHIADSTSFPDLKHMTTMEMGSNGDCIIPNTLESTVPGLHVLLYNDAEYTPSKTVKAISNNIISLKRKYEEENKIKASIKASEEAAEEERKRKEASRASGSSAKKKKKKATESNANVDPNPLLDDDDEDDILVKPLLGGEDEYYDYENGDYEEEPEEDELEENQGIEINPDIFRIVPPGGESNERIDSNAPISNDINIIPGDRNIPSNLKKVDEIEEGDRSIMPGSPVGNFDDNVNISRNAPGEIETTTSISPITNNKPVMPISIEETSDTGIIPGPPIG